VSQKVSTLCLLVVCTLGINLSLWGQNASATRGIPGYMDPRTGIFHALPSPEIQDATVEAPAVTTFGGKFVVNFTITVSSTIASTNKIGCEVSASLADVSGTFQNFISETASVAVTRGTASTVTCSVTIPYSWKLASSATDMVSLAYVITSPVEVSTVAGQFPTRTSSAGIATIKVPANGAITTEAVAATI